MLTSCSCGSRKSARRSSGVSPRLGLAHAAASSSVADAVLHAAPFAVAPCLRACVPPAPVRLAFFRARGGRGAGGFGRGGHVGASSGTMVLVGDGSGAVFQKKKLDALLANYRRPGSGFSPDSPREG